MQRGELRLGQANQARAFPDAPCDSRAARPVRIYRISTPLDSLNRGLAHSGPDPGSEAGRGGIPYLRNRCRSSLLVLVGILITGLRTQAYSGWPLHHVRHSVAAAEGQRRGGASAAGYRCGDEKGMQSNAVGGHGSRVKSWMGAARSLPPSPS